MRKNSKYTNSDDKNEKYYVHLSAILVLEFCFQGKILDDMYSETNDNCFLKMQFYFF